MEKRVLNYRVVITPDERTGTDEFCYTAYVPVLGIATDGDSIEEALANIKDAIRVYIESIIEAGEELPSSHIDRDFVTTASIEIPGLSQHAN